MARAQPTGHLALQSAVVVDLHLGIALDPHMRQLDERRAARSLQAMRE